jgi:hypothetical protein
MKRRRGNAELLDAENVTNISAKDSAPIARTTTALRRERQLIRLDRALEENLVNI